MSPRCKTLSLVGFITAVLLAGVTAAHAQPMRYGSPGRHEPLSGPLTAEQIKQAFERFGGITGLPPGIPPDYLNLLRREMQKGANKGSPERLQVDEGLKQWLENPAVQQELERLKKNGRFPIQPDEFAKSLKNLPPLPQSSFVTPPPSGQPPTGGHEPPKAQTNPMQQPFAEPTVPPRPPSLPQIDPKIPFERMPAPPNIPFKPFHMPPFLDGNHPPILPPQPFDAVETPRERALRAAASLWEHNIGPLDETPAVKRALFEIVEGTENLKDPQGNSLWDTLSREAEGNRSLSDFLDNAATGEGLKMPKLDFSFGSWGNSTADIGQGEASSNSPGESWWSRRRSSASGPSSTGSGWEFGVPGFGGSWGPVVLLAVVLLGTLIWWRFWYLRDPRMEPALAVAGLGSWPIDPRRIASRKDVVLAFEYLSVLICGPSAQTWTHTTIAQALADLATTHGRVAPMLARLYELARYAPLNEPLTTDELVEARRLVCQLSGLEGE